MRVEAAGEELVRVALGEGADPHEVCPHPCNRARLPLTIRVEG